MLRIETPTADDAELLSQLAIQTFIESHGPSAAKKDIDEFVNLNLNVDVLKKDLSDPTNIFRIAYFNDGPVGFFKIIFNCANPKIDERKVCKLERIYVLQKYHDQKIGKHLFDLILELAKQNLQKGIWLYVWTENKRALRFYEKQGFQKIADTYFKISETHSNPNYWLYLRF